MALLQNTQFTVRNQQADLGIIEIDNLTIPSSIFGVPPYLDFDLLTLTGMQDKMGDILSVFVDATNVTDPVNVQNQLTRQQCRWPARTQGWLALTANKTACKLAISTLAGGVINMAFSTVLMPQFLYTVGPAPFSGSAGVTSVAAAAANTQIIAANVLRKRLGVSLENAGTTDAYVFLGSANPTSTNRSFKMVPDAYWESPYGYIGEIRARWAGAPAGQMNVTEYS